MDYILNLALILFAILSLETNVYQMKQIDKLLWSDLYGRVLLQFIILIGSILMFVYQILLRNYDLTTLENDFKILLMVLIVFMNICYIHTFCTDNKLRYKLHWLHFVISISGILFSSISFVYLIYFN